MATFKELPPPVGPREPRDRSDVPGAKPETPKPVAPGALSPDRLEASIRGRTAPIWSRARSAEDARTKAPRGGSLVEVMLAQERHDLERRMDPAGLSAFHRRELKKRIARAVAGTPYGASKDELRAALFEDPHVAAALSREDALEEVEALAREEDLDRQRYFARWGSEAAAFELAHGPFRTFEQLEERIRLLDELLAAPARLIPTPLVSLARTDRSGLISLDLVADVEVSRVLKGAPEKAPEHYLGRYPRGEHLEAEKNRFLMAGAPPEILALRRTIQEALPHWTFKEIAEAHQRQAEYYAPYTGGPKTFSPEEVQALMGTYPEILGAEQLYQKQEALREQLKETLLAATPGENFYGVLDRAVEQLERKGYGASIFPQDVLKTIRGSAELSATLDERFDAQTRARDAALYPWLASRVAQVFGDRIHRYSIAEIAARMRLDDPSFSEGLLLDLIAECPAVFGAVPFARTERNFVIAMQVNRTMRRIWPGATYDDVAKLLVSLGPLGQVPPDFCGKDVEILQGYDFMQPWPGGRKPDTAGQQAQIGQSRLMRELMVPLSFLLPEDVEVVRLAIISQLAQDPERTTVPPALEERLDRAYVRALRKGLATIFGALGHRSLDPDHESSRYLDFLDGKEGVALTEAELKAVLSNPRTMGAHVRHPEALARLLTKTIDGTYAEALIDRTWTVQKSPSSGTIPEAADAVNLLHQVRSARKEVSSDLLLYGYQSIELRKELDRFGLIPLTLETTERVVRETLEEYKEAGKAPPFTDTRVVMIQHELGQAYPQVLAYQKLGMDPEKCIFVGVPYHPNQEVEEALVRSTGVDGRFSAQGDLDALHARIQEAVDDTMARRRPDEKVLIVCDGPYARRYFDERYLSADPSLAEHVRFTEQTARGDRPIDRADRTKRVVSYARHEQKVEEAPYIGRSCVKAINAVLFELRDTMENKSILLTGLGPIGQATAEALIGAGAKVRAYEKHLTPEQRAWAAGAGVTLVDDPVEAARGAFMIVGSSGETSIDREVIDASGPNTYFVSVTSELLEIELKHLATRATDAEGRICKMLGAAVGQQPTWFYRLEDGTVRIVVGGGLPVNFNHVNSLPPEIVDFTIALSVAAGVQAMEGSDLGFERLTRHSALIERSYQAYLARAAGTPASVAARERET